MEEGRECFEDRKLSPSLWLLLLLFSFDSVREEMSAAPFITKFS